MIEKALFIIIVVYALSFCTIAGQYLYGDVFGVTMTNWQGTPIRSALLDVIQTDTLNEISVQIISANSTTNSTITGIERAFTVGYNVGWDLVTLMTGTYIFNFLYLMLGPPQSGIIVAPMVMIYVFLLARAIMSYIRNG